MGFYKDRWIEHYERAVADREFAGFNRRAAEQLAKHDADEALGDELATQADEARMIAKENR